MTGADLLREVFRRGGEVWANGDWLELEYPDGFPDDLIEALKQRKAEILSTIRRRMVGDGQAPPLDRPPATERELRRWMDHTADPEVFDRWLAWAMSYSDPVEE
jgi:hypothetical protein